jgi:RNA-binding protein YhbY
VQTVETEHLLEELEWNLVHHLIKIAVVETADTVFTDSAEAAEAAEITELAQVQMAVETADLV